MQRPKHAIPEPQWKRPWYEKHQALLIGVGLLLFLVVVVRPVFRLFPSVPTLVENQAFSETTQPQVLIKDVQPITLGCHAYVTAAIDLDGERSHKISLPWVGFTYRRDTVELRGSADVDVCVENTATEVVETVTGHRVNIDSSDIVIRRPRLDHRNFQIRTKDGWLSDLTHAIPGVSDNSPLVDQALAQAQYAISTGECVGEAWEAVEQAIRASYATEYADLEVEVVMPSYPVIEDLVVEAPPEMSSNVSVSADVTCLTREGPPDIHEADNQEGSS